MPRDGAVRRPVQMPLAFGSAADYSPDNFIVSECNREAWELVRRWPEWPAYGLFLHGPEACGKTHLARLWAERAGAEFLAPPDVERWLGASPSTFVRLVFEGIDAIATEAEQRGLFHVLNRARESGGHVLLTSRQPAAALDRVTLPDLGSRLRAMPSVPVGQPDDSLLETLFVKQFADRQLAVDRKTILFLVSRMERSFPAAQRLVEALDTASIREKSAITIPLAKRTVQLHQ